LRRGGLIIEGTITTIVIIGFEVVVGLIIFAYALYITFLSLFKTIQDNLQVLKERGEQNVQTAINEGYDSMFDVRIGLMVAIPPRKSCQQIKDNPDCF
jgi:hypothetical protein